MEYIYNYTLKDEPILIYVCLKLYIWWTPYLHHGILEHLTNTVKCRNKNDDPNNYFGIIFYS